jgi:hypothetical protein
MVRYTLNPKASPNLQILLSPLLKGNDKLKTLMKQLTLLLLVVKLMACHAQTAITGNINPGVAVANVERNFVGFNSGQGNLESIYNFRAVGGLETNPYLKTIFNTVSPRTYWRFPGGTTSNYYNRWGSGYGNSGILQTFGDNVSYLSVNLSLRDKIYGSYSNYTANLLYPNSKSNVIFPFINSITNNRTTTGNVVFCLNVVNHYRGFPTANGVIGFDTRTETLRDTNKIKAIKNMNDFNRSTLSPLFKSIVLQNIDAILTLIQNGGNVYKVELGNELYGYQYNDNILLNYNAFVSYNSPYSLYFPSDTKVWLKDDGSAQSIKDSYSSLWTFAHLTRMYKLLIRDTLQKLAVQQPGNPVFTNHLNNMKFGVPVTPTLTSGFRKWDEFFRQPDVKAYIGLDAYVMHPYLDSSNYFKGYNLSPANTATFTTLTKEFNAIRDTLEIAYNTRFFKKNHVNLINAFPAGTEVWYTEWDFNFDNTKLVKVGNTLLHSMFYYDAMMDFFDINANRNLQVKCNKTNPIKLCNYHVPYAKSITWYPMVRFSNGYATLLADPGTTRNSVPNYVQYNANYYAHQLLAPVLNDDAMVYIDNTNGGFNSVPNCTFRSFYKKTSNGTCSKDNVYIYFNNKSANSYKINLNTALKISDSKCVHATKTYMYANNLYASMGQTTFRTDDVIYTDTLKGAADITIQRINDQVIPSSTFGQVVIPKYSVGYIKAEITIPSATCGCSNTSARSESSTSSARLANTQNIEEEKQDITLLPTRMYPNPATTGNVTIEVSSSKEIPSQLMIFDITGNLVKSSSNTLSVGQNTLQIDVSDLAKSLYLIRLQGEDINFTDKLILQ